MATLELSEAINIADAAGPPGTAEGLRRLVEARLLPVFGAGVSGASGAVLEDDFRELLQLAQLCASQSGGATLGSTLELAGLLPTIVRTRDGSMIPLRDALNGGTSLAFRPAVRALIQAAQKLQPQPDLVANDYVYFGGTCVHTANKRLGKLAVEQFERAENIEDDSRSDFARSAHYMGSKRRLGSFLVEALASVLPRDAVLLDLMCGSGAASAAFVKQWSTVASDAQQFCQLLALIQGGGYSEGRAKDCIARLIPRARHHADALRRQLHPWVDLEDDLFHHEIDESLLEQYRKFLREFPLYPLNPSGEGWNPFREVERRRSELVSAPHCLFTAYFANIYFGLRQAIEIDSLRTAIMQLDSAIDRQWALGALVVAASIQATTYAAHFAQPAITDPSQLTLRRLSGILERRSGSIYHELSVRLLSLARQSERAREQVEIVSGPWQSALRDFARHEPDRPKAVYIDAPYTRDEYSRYYHVLETLVTYNYPTVAGRGRAPDRGKDRFVSELFTRSRPRMEAALTAIITQVVRSGSICAWSYSDSGVARIPAIVESVRAAIRPIAIRSFAVPFQHKSHGRRQHKQVTEYLLTFQTD